MLFASVVVVCLTILALAWRAERLVSRWLSLNERDVTQASTPDPVLPDDLRKLADRESAEWAASEVKRAMLEAYHAASGEPADRWAKVRVRFKLALNDPNAGSD